MSAGSEDRITVFERRCRLLLRLYPVAYRAERGEEIIGTLLEATPEGRAWPLPRDIRGLAPDGRLSNVPLLSICAAVAAPAVWLLRRQSAHAGRPTRT